MQRTQVGFGKAVFDTGSITIAAFVVEEKFTRTFVSKKCAMLAKTSRYPTTNYPDISGFLFSDTVEAPEGTVICIQASEKMRGKPIRAGALFIRVRAQGAAMLVTCHIPHNGKCTLASHDHIVFSGRGDILSLDDLEALGMAPHSGYVSSFMDEEELAECYAIQVVSPEVAPAPVAEVHIAASGDKIVLNVATPMRRVRIRR